MKSGRGKCPQCKETIVVDLEAAEIRCPFCNVLLKKSKKTVEEVRAEEAARVAAAEARERALRGEPEETPVTATAAVEEPVTEPTPVVAATEEPVQESVVTEPTQEEVAVTEPVQEEVAVTEPVQEDVPVETPVTESEATDAPVDEIGLTDEELAAMDETIPVDSVEEEAPVTDAAVADEIGLTDEELAAMDAPVTEELVEETPVEDALSEEMPVDDVVAEDALVEETPVDAPVDEIGLTDEELAAMDAPVEAAAPAPVVEEELVEEDPVLEEEPADDATELEEERVEDTLAEDDQAALLEDIPVDDALVTPTDAETAEDALDDVAAALVEPQDDLTAEDEETPVEEPVDEDETVVAPVEEERVEDDLVAVESATDSVEDDLGYTDEDMAFAASLSDGVRTSSSTERRGYVAPVVKPVRAATDSGRTDTTNPTANDSRGSKGEKKMSDTAIYKKPVAVIMMILAIIGAAISLFFHNLDLVGKISATLGDKLAEVSLKILEMMPKLNMIDVIFGGIVVLISILGLTGTRGKPGFFFTLLAGLIYLAEALFVGLDPLISVDAITELYVKFAEYINYAFYGLLALGALAFMISIAIGKEELEISGATSILPILYVLLVVGGYVALVLLPFFVEKFTVTESIIKYAIFGVVGLSILLTLIGVHSSTASRGANAFLLFATVMIVALFFGATVLLTKIATSKGVAFPAEVYDIVACSSPVIVFFSLIGYTASDLRN